MKVDRPKALAQTAEKPLIDHVLEALTSLAPVKTVVVVGHKRELLEEHLRTSPSAKGHLLQFAHQEAQLGTGDAVKCALPLLQGFRGQVLITYADHPLFTPQTLDLFVKYHEAKKATLSLISFQAPIPNTYGRIIRDASGTTVKKITEAKDCSVEQLLISEVNSGVYVVDSAFLKPAIDGLTNDNAQKEYYLTDIVEKAATEGQTVVAFPLSDATEAGGVNNPSELARVNQILAARRLRKLEDSGVVFEDAATCWVDPSVTIATGAHIGPNVQLRGATTIGEGVVIEGSAYVVDTTIEKDALLRFGVRIEAAVIGAESSVGPFAHIRPGTKLGRHVRIGNFVETKNTILADGAKASHLTYLGDCTVGEESNIGAGTITCNYDGYKKYKTEIGKNVFIGSNSALVAPITIGDGALVAAGSTITKDVAPGDLALGRAKQESRSGWASRRTKTLERKV